MGRYCALITHCQVSITPNIDSSHTYGRWVVNMNQGIEYMDYVCMRRVIQGLV